MINPGHPLVKLSKAVDWKRLEEVFGETYCPDNGRPAISTKHRAASPFSFFYLARLRPAAEPMPLPSRS
jgi:hypothetical protein